MQTEISQRSKANVRENGEVFTPFLIVDQMLALIPETAWANPSCGFIEPACGNGQILVKIFERRIASGLAIEDALNTLVGMDISGENIADSIFRLCERAAAQMLVEGMAPGTKRWFDRAAKLFAVLENNIFKVKDSLAYIKSGELEGRKFFSNDPTGHKQTLSPTAQKQRLAAAKSKVKALSPF